MHRFSFLTFLLCLLAFALPSMVHGEESKRTTFTLVIDAGHGGHDAGAIGAYSKEKDINLRVALAFGRLVEDNCDDVKVIYTRRTDVFIPLQRRADIANNAKADLFISVHTNALPAGRIAYGSETYSLGMARAAANLAVAKRENAVITLETDYRQTYEGFDPNKAESYVIFEFMQDKFMKQSVDLASCIQREYKRAGRPDKGVHQAGFLVLRNTSMPSVLTELGFITTPKEETYLNSAEGVQQLSRSIYNGFLAYRRQHDKRAVIPADVSLDKAQPKLSTKAAQTKEGDDEWEVVPVKATPTAQLEAARKAADTTARVAVAQTEVVKPQPTTLPKTTQKAAVREKANTPKAEPKPVAKADTKAKAEAKPAAKASKDKAAQKETSKDKAAKAKVTPSKKGDADGVTYRIQVGAGKRKIETDDPQFKGLRIERLKEGDLYKYYYGAAYATHAEARKALQTAQAKLPGAYIIGYIKGKAVSAAEARAHEKSAKK